MLLLAEHSIVRPNDLSKVGLAFFTLNGVISLLIGVLGVIDVLV
jgi:4-hydroxybenzoate polyprenyltransferase